jgi:hypothetical protein
MNKEIIKSKAKALRTFLAAQGMKLNHSACLEAIAHIEGNASYNVLQSKFQPAPTIELPKEPSFFDDFVQGEFDVHAGVLPAYRYGNLVASLGYSRTLSRSHLQLFVYEVFDDGEGTDDNVTRTCIPMQLESNLEECKNYVQKVARLLGGYLSAQMGVRALGWAITAVTETATPDWDSIKSKLNALTTTPFWDVEVCRMGYGHTTLDFDDLRSRKQAEALALEEACNCDFTENNSDYVIVGKDEEKSEPPFEEEDLVLDEPGSWTVEVCRISYGTMTFRIQAATLKEAEEVALEGAGNHYFSEHESEYVVNMAYPSK